MYHILRRWVEKGVAGIEPRSSAPIDHARKVDLQAMAEVRRLQQNPELGEWRVHAALKQMGIELSSRTCGRILALNRKLYGLRKPSRAPREPKEMPFAATVVSILTFPTGSIITLGVAAVIAGTIARRSRISDEQQG